VHQAADDLEKKPVVHDEYLGFQSYIDEAIDRTGEGPSTGAVIDQATHSFERDPAAGDDYTITGPGTDAAFCMHMPRRSRTRRRQQSPARNGPWAASTALAAVPARPRRLGCRNRLRLR
jgi:hypothetical protein